MAMPNNLILVRHGHSQGNSVVEAAKQGDDSLFTAEFRERPGHLWRLTDEGREQARQTGEWILQHIGATFDRYYVSPYTRSRETAALLNLPDAKWRIDQRLRERDWGEIGSLPRNEFQAAYPQNARMKHHDSTYWRPPGGESIPDVRQRVRSMLDTLHRECADRSVVIVTHGEFMWATRSELEYMTDQDLAVADKDPSQKIHNAQVSHYSRLDPDTGEQGKYIDWVRNIRPGQEDGDSGWRPIERKLYTNQELLDQ